MPVITPGHIQKWRKHLFVKHAEKQKKLEGAVNHIEVKDIVVNVGRH